MSGLSLLVNTGSQAVHSVGDRNNRSGPEVDVGSTLAPRVALWGVAPQ